MQQEIRAYYFKLILPAVVCCFLLFILERLNISVFLGEVSKAGTVLLIVLSAFFSIVLPLWFRIFFIRRVRGQQEVSVEQFIKFEKTFLLIAELSLYIVLIAYVFKVPRAQMLFIALFGFYAAYYYFPSAKRLDHEKKLFRIQG
jgi:hypothetical protein